MWDPPWSQPVSATGLGTPVGALRVFTLQLPEPPARGTQREEHFD